MEIAIENDLTFSARPEIRTMAQRSRLITELNHLFSIMNDIMRSDDNLSYEDVNHSISPMRHCQTVTGRQSIEVDLGPDGPTPGRGLYHGGDTESRVANPDSLCIKSI